MLGAGIAVGAGLILVASTGTDEPRSAGSIGAPPASAEPPDDTYAEAADDCIIRQPGPGAPSGGTGRKDVLPYQEWAASPQAQDAIGRLNYELNRAYGREPSSLNHGFIGITLDDFNQAFVVVVDTALIDAPELQSELRDVASDAIDVEVVGSCNPAGELLEAHRLLSDHPQDLGDPGLDGLSYGYSLDPATSEYELTVSTTDPERIAQIQEAAGDTIRVEGGVSHEQYGRPDDTQPHRGGAR